MSDLDLLPPNVLRAIGDKLYEKRKDAALQVEQIVKQLSLRNDQQRIHAIIDKIIGHAFSQQANYRKGALLCLAAATVGLGEPTQAQLSQIVPPVLASFTDQDSRVRYYACEACYNIAKVARESFIVFFSEVFDAMFRLCADSEANVQNAVQFLDNLVKDIVTASTRFDVGAFIPKLRDYLRVVNPNKRQFLISWITVLDSSPDLDMLQYLPDLLEGLMTMLSDPNREIRTLAHKVMMEFLIEIQATRRVDWPRLSTILVDKAASSDEMTRQTAIKWLKEFVCLASSQLVSSYPAILGAVLSNISHPSREIQAVSHEANTALLTLQPADKGPQVDTGAILAVISRELRNEQEMTRLEALRWIHFLLQRNQAQVLDQLPMLLPALLDAMSAPSEAVVVQALSVLAAIAACPQQFRPILESLLGRFRGEQGVQLLHRSGMRTIRRLCSRLGPRAVLTEMSSILQAEQDLAFASMMAQALNLILLTAPEVRELRELLLGAASNSQGASLFVALYHSWSHSAGAALSLCFLSQAYEHACALIASFLLLPVGEDLLVQIDRLVELLESPCFSFLRLQLLQPATHPALLRACYSLLMLLPQSNAFRKLNSRLSALPTLALLQLDAAAGAAHSSFSSSTVHASSSTYASGSPQHAGLRGAHQSPQHPAGSSTTSNDIPLQSKPGDWVDSAALLTSFRALQLKHCELEERRRIGETGETWLAWAPGSAYPPAGTFSKVPDAVVNNSSLPHNSNVSSGHESVDNTKDGRTAGGGGSRHASSGGAAAAELNSVPASTATAAPGKSVAAGAEAAAVPTNVRAPTNGGAVAAPDPSTNLSAGTAAVHPATVSTQQQTKSTASADGKPVHATPAVTLPNSELDFVNRGKGSESFEAVAGDSRRLSSGGGLGMGRLEALLSAGGMTVNMVKEKAPNKATAAPVKAPLTS